MIAISTLPPVVALSMENTSRDGSHTSEGATPPIEAVYQSSSHTSVSSHEAHIKIERVQETEFSPTETNTNSSPGSNTPTHQTVTFLTIDNPLINRADNSSPYQGNQDDDEFGDYMHLPHDFKFEVQEGGLLEQPGKRRLKEWLVEQINSGRYDGLRWLNDEKTLFSVPWKHAREKTYQMEKDAALYKEWASYSGKHRKSESNAINWKLNFRCALYSVRGIKERKDVYIKGHRVYELTENTGDTPLIEYPSPNALTPQNKSFRQFEGAEETEDISHYGDLMPHFWQSSQGTSSQTSSQVDNCSQFSSQLSVTNVFSGLAPLSEPATSPSVMNISNTASGVHTPTTPNNRILMKPHINLPMLNSATTQMTPLSPYESNAGGAALITTPTRFPYTTSLQRLEPESHSPPSIIHAVMPASINTMGKRCSANSAPSGLILSKGPDASNIDSSNSVASLKIPSYSSLANTTPIFSSSQGVLGFISIPSTRNTFLTKIDTNSPHTQHITHPQSHFIVTTAAPTTTINTNTPDMSSKASISLPLASTNNTHITHTQQQMQYYKPKLEPDHNNVFEEQDTTSNNNENCLKRGLPTSYESKSQETPAKRLKSLSSNAHSLCTNLETISTVDMHTCVQPIRIIVSGYPHINGSTLLEKRRYVIERLDYLRQRLMCEPRGFNIMNGVILTIPDLPEADIAALFMNSEGYSAMCGSSTIAIGRYAIDTRLVTPTSPETKLSIQTPCGVVKTFVEYKDGKSGRVRFHSVPAFLYARDLEIDLPTYGLVKYDISFGGMFFAIISAQQFGIDLENSPVSLIRTAGREFLEQIRDTVKIEYSVNPELATIYGAILIDTNDQELDQVTTGFTVYANEQIDRSPCGSGVISRIALQYYKSYIQLGDLRTFKGPSNGFFTGRALREETITTSLKGVVVEISGQSFYSGSSNFSYEMDDPFRNGFSLF